MFTIISGAFLRIILGAAFEYVTNSKAMYKPIPIVGIPLSISMILSGHTLGPLLIFGFFIIDYSPVIAAIARKLSPKNKIYEKSKKEKPNAKTVSRNKPA